MAAAVLIAVLNREGTTRPQAEPTAGNTDVGRAGDIPGWATPGATAVSTAPASVAPAPALPPVGITSFSVANGHPAATPAGTPTGPAKPKAPPPVGSTGEPPTQPGVTSPPPQNATAYRTTQGESFAEQNGVQNEPGKNGSGVHVGFISTGDWVRYDDVGFTDEPANTLLISASNAARQNRTGQVQLRLDSRSNAPIGSLTIANNGDWFAFTTYAMKIKPTTGVHTVYLTFTSDQPEEFANVDWLRFQH